MLARNMRFKTYFEQAKEHLKKLGIVVTMIQGKPVTDAMLEEIEADTGLKLPVSFKEFLLEMGQSFTFEYRVNSLGEDHFFQWELDEISMDDVVQRFREDVKLLSEEGKHPEMADRLNWLPIWSYFDGDRLCIDCMTGKIRYHDTCYGEAAVVIADSMEHWVSSWSRYCFSDPVIENRSKHSLFQTSCWSVTEGHFAWDASQFAEKFDRCSRS